MTIRQSPPPHLALNVLQQCSPELGVSELAGRLDILKMKLSQTTSRPSGLPLYYSAGSEFRFCCMLVAALALFGCSAQQVRAQSDPIENMPVKSDVRSPLIAVPTLPPAIKAEPPAALVAAASEDNTIFFPAGSNMVDDIGKQKLRQHAEHLKQNPKIFVTLVGSAFGQGSRSYNLALAEERLMAVNTLLRTYGVSPRQIRRNRVGNGRNQAPCTSTDCLQEISKVVLMYSP